MTRGKVILLACLVTVATAGGFLLARVAVFEPLGSVSFQTQAKQQFDECKLRCPNPRRTFILQGGGGETGSEWLCGCM